MELIYWCPVASTPSMCSPSGWGSCSCMGNDPTEWRFGWWRRLSTLPARDEEEYWWGRESEVVTLYDEEGRES